MMDPLSVAASIITLIQVTNQVALTCYRIQGKYRNAEEEISDMINEVDNLLAILDALEVTKPTDPLPPCVDSTVRKPLLDLSTVLGAFLVKIEPLAKPGLKTKLRWPFESKNVGETVDSIQRLKTTLQLALQVNQTKGVEKTAEMKKRIQILQWYKRCDPEQNHRLVSTLNEPSCDQQPEL